MRSLTVMKSQQVAVKSPTIADEVAEEKQKEIPPMQNIGAPIVTNTKPRVDHVKVEKAEKKVP